MKATVLDSISRELSGDSTRRGVLRLLGRATAAVAVGATAVHELSEPTAAKRRRRKRARRSRRPADTSQSAQIQRPPAASDPTAAAKIGPNCIFVCCDGTCDSWKMCLKCVKWPDPPPTTSVAITG